MSFSIAFIKDSLKKIISELDRQGKILDELLAERQARQEQETKTSGEDRQAMLDRLAKARDAKAQKAQEEQKV